MGNLTDLFKELDVVAASGNDSPHADQFNYLRRRGIITNPEEVCFSVNAVPDGKLNGIIDSLSKTFSVSAAITHAKNANTLVCDLSEADMPTIDAAAGQGKVGGFTNQDRNYLGIDTSANGYSRTAAEEFIHMYQDARPLDTARFAGPDQFIWQMGIEAQAKLSVAVAAVREKMNGNMELYRSHNMVGGYMEGEDKATYYLNKQVTEHGPEALSDPEVLARAFTLIMNDTKTADSYFKLKEGIYTGAEGTTRITAEEFVKNFGYLVGDDPKNNFLSGNISTMNEVFSFINDKSRVHEWLTVQNQTLETAAGAPAEKLNLE